MIDIYVQRTLSKASSNAPITSGSVGLMARFHFSVEWDELRKKVIFETDNYKEWVDIPESGEVVVPGSVLVYPRMQLRVGVRGESDDGSVVIPTVYADCGTISLGANTTPVGTPPTPSQAECLQAQIDELRESDIELDATLTESGKAADAGAVGEYVHQYVLNFVSGNLDTTLMKSGMAADAAAVGQRITQSAASFERKLAEKQPKGNYVKSVNGQTPDEDGNVTVESGGGVSEEFVRDYVEARLTAETSTTLLPETTFDGFAPNSAYLNQHTKIITPPPFSLAIGETYHVVWNDVEYTCVGQDASALVDGAVAIGNLEAANIGSGNNEPFGIGVNANACILFSLEGLTENTVAVYGDSDRVATENFVKSYVEQYISEALGGDY